MNTKALSLLGLASRAQKTTTGEELVLKAIRQGKVKLVIISEDLSLNTTKKISDKCKFYNVTLRKAGTRDILGGAIGKESRAIIAILDQGFAKKLIELLD